MLGNKKVMFSGPHFPRKDRGCSMTTVSIAVSRLLQLGNVAKIRLRLSKGPFKSYVIKEVGGDRKWQFLMIYSTVNHQGGGWVGLK